MYILYCTNTIMLTVHNVSAIQSLVLYGLQVVYDSIYRHEW